MFLKTFAHFFFISSSRTLYIEVYFFIIFNLIFLMGFQNFQLPKSIFPTFGGENRM